MPLNLNLWAWSAFGGAVRNWEPIYCKVLLGGLEEPRVDYNLTQGQIWHETQPRAIGSNSQVDIHLKSINQSFNPM